MKDLEREALSLHPAFRLAENRYPSFHRLDFVKDLEREALSPPILSGLPKIIPHLSTDSICSKDLEREALSLFPLFRLAKNLSAFSNRLDLFEEP